MSAFNTDWREKLPTLKSVIESHDLRARKSLGQNFIMDANITDRIAQAAGDVTGARLIEIGPGPGGLTRSLLSTNSDQVVAIEFDVRAVAALEHLKNAAGDRLILWQDDALKINWPDFLREHPRNIIVANLPYNISTVLLAQWLEVIADMPHLIDRMVLMFQKEVADRLTAPVASADYGRLSIMTQWLTTPQSVMVLPPGVFVPPPKIYSSVVRFEPKKNRTDKILWRELDQLLTRAFMHRRKMLRSNLKEFLPFLDAEQIALTDRAQDIALEAWLRLAVRIGTGK